MSLTGQFRSFGPFFNAGLLVATPRIYHYLPGTTTLKNGWTTQAKAFTIAQPLVGDANGLASAYFDGLYKIVVKNSDESVMIATWDNLLIAESVLSVVTPWTPVLDCANHGNLSVTYVLQQASAVKVGDQVLIHGNLICTPTYTTATGAVIVSGAPYDVTGSVIPTGMTAIVNASGAATYKSHICTIETVKTMKFRKVDHTVFSTLNITDFPTGVEIWLYFSLLYQGIE